MFGASASECRAPDADDVSMPVRTVAMQDFITRAVMLEGFNPTVFSYAVYVILSW
jgi:hypothetical protein